MITCIILTEIPGSMHGTIHKEISGMIPGVTSRVLPEEDFASILEEFMVQFVE